MDQNAKNLLVEIGRQLDCAIFPKVRNGGFVVPSASTVSLSQLGKEKHHAGKREESSAAESPESWSRLFPWERASRESGSLAGPWPTGSTPSVVIPIANGCPEPLSRICEYYPGARIWEQNGGFWLLVKSSLLPNLGRTVMLLIAVSITNKLVRAWAFWNSAIGSQWIGPRHTNFPDGSICAYDPSDRTWEFGDPIVTLLDIYMVWALRHLHLEVEGRWPGPQSAPHIYERLLELRDNELCGCGRSAPRKYSQCCKASDLRANRLAEAIRFGAFSDWSCRQPPAAIMQFIDELKQPPELEIIFPSKYPKTR